jgi:hypothetical protein
MTAVAIAVAGSSALGAAGVLGGCANPDSAVGFQEQDPAARIRAIQQAAASKDEAAVPGLIQLLESDDPAERLLAIRALERITGQTMGYDHAAPVDERRAAAERWGGWYAGRTKDNGGGALSSPPARAEMEKQKPGS